jgi:hypothetical protein
MLKTLFEIILHLASFKSDFFFFSSTGDQIQGLVHARQVLLSLTATSATLSHVCYLSYMKPWINCFLKWSRLCELLFSEVLFLLLGKSYFVVFLKERWQKKSSAFVKFCSQKHCCSHHTLEAPRASKVDSMGFIKTVHILVWQSIYFKLHLIWKVP